MLTFTHLYEIIIYTLINLLFKIQEKINLLMLNSLKNFLTHQ